MIEPKITIIVPTHNRVHILGETIESIIKQTFTKWEMLIIDDHSSDDTGDFVKEFMRNDPRIFYFLKNKNNKKGPSGSRNYGLDLAIERKAEIIQFFDDDDLMHPEKLELQVVPFIENPKVELTICRYKRYLPYEGENSSFSSSTIQTEDLAKDFLFNRIKVNIGGPMIKASLLKKERFNEDLIYGEEREFFLKLFFKFEPKVIFINQVLFYYRYHKISLTQDDRLATIRLGSNVKVLQNVWDYLYQNNLLRTDVVPFFLRQFLLENHNKDYIQKVYLFTRKKNELNLFHKLKFRFLISFHQFYIKVFYKLLLLK